MKLIDIDKLNPSTYNPRIADSERLNLIELSLKKLGFVLPLFATNEGEIISGHQRHYVAKKMGLKKVPVEFIGNNISLKDRKNINILFNLGTNDAPKLMQGSQLKKYINSFNVFEKAKNIPDKDINNSIEMFPCMNLTEINLDILIKKNYKRFDSYYLNKTKHLNNVSHLMPIIVNENYEVINGIGRLHLLTINKNKNINVKCIVLPDYLEEFANYMLNYVTMDFDIHNKYKDELRYNSFKRHFHKTSKLGQSYYKKISKTNPGKNLSKDFINKFRREYGNYILDFGAGHLRNAFILNDTGIKCVPFEPFVVNFNNYNQLDFDKSIEVCDNFLEEYKSNSNFSSIFLNAVFNSVPFVEDRKKILCILSEIANNKCKIVIWTTSIKMYYEKIKRVMNNDENSSMSVNTNLLSYENNITIQDIADNPKVQKYMSDKEVIQLCKPYFKNIKAKDMGNYIYCECTQPIKQSWDEIEEALDFEFNLKHPNGKRLGLNEKAKQIFKEVREKRGGE